jgi:anti-sigma B factor antagonist
MLVERVTTMTFHFDETHPDVLILEADSAIDSLDVQAGLDELVRLLEAGARWLIVDCTKVGYVSSVGLTTLIRLHKRLIERGGVLMLAAVPAPLGRLLHMTRLEQVFVIHGTVEDARQAVMAAARA